MALRTAGEPRRVRSEPFELGAECVVIQPGAALFTRWRWLVLQHVVRALHRAGHNGSFAVLVANSIVALTNASASIAEA